VREHLVRVEQNACRLAVAADRPTDVARLAGADDAGLVGNLNDCHGDPVELADLDACADRWLRAIRDQRTQAVRVGRSRLVTR
jgi:hypothetical protein